jgi:hypothetical protein
MECGELMTVMAPPFSLLQHLLSRSADAMQGTPHADVNGTTKALRIGTNHRLTVAVHRVGDEQVKTAWLSKSARWDFISPLSGDCLIGKPRLQERTAKSSHLNG